MDLLSCFFIDKKGIVVIQSMTSGNPIKLILLFSIPIMLGNLFQQVYILSDLYILGHYLGLHALAVAGAMTPVFIMCILIATGFTNGLCIITAQRFGANDIRAVRKSFTTGLMLSSFFAVTIIAFLTFNMDFILIKMNVPADIFEDAGRFMKILGYSLMATIFYNYLAGVMRALGDSKTPLYFLIFSSVLNVIINVGFIVYLKTDVTGAAFGTGIAQTISVLLCFGYLFWRFPMLRIQKKDWTIPSDFLYEHLKIAIPMSVQFSVIGLGIIVVQSVCNTFGSDTIAAFASASRIEQLATMPLFSLGIALTTYTAQNYGARLIRRIKQGVLQCFIFSGGLSILMALIAYEWGEQIATVFLNHPSEQVMNQAVTYLHITTPFYFFLALIFVFRQALQGMGYAIFPLISGIIELGMRWIGAIYLASVWGYAGICYAGPFAWIGAAVWVFAWYFIIMRRYKVSLFGQLNQTTPLLKN